jgi:hypothetical protein
MNNYEGEMKDNRKHGKGTLKYNGNEYTGYFKNDLFDGKGKLTFADGTVFEGNFTNGVYMKGIEFTDGSY